MDGQNFNNDQVVETQTPVEESTNYQDNTTAYEAPVQTAEAKPATPALSIVGLVLGIISILCMCCGWVGILFGIGGIVCAIFGNKQEKTGIGKAALICSIVGLVLSAIIWILALVGVGAMSSLVEDSYTYY